MDCPHGFTRNRVRDIIYVVIALILVFIVVREGISWYFKTNHIHSELRAIRERLDRHGV